MADHCGSRGKCVVTTNNDNWKTDRIVKALQTQVEIDHDVSLAKNQDFLEKAYEKIDSSNESFTKQDIEQAEKWAVELLKIQDVRQSLSSTKDIRIAQTLVGLKI